MPGWHMLFPRLPVRFALIAWLAGCGFFWFFPQLPSALRWPARLLFVALAVSALFGLARLVRTGVRQPRRALFALAAILIGAGIPYLCIEATCWTWLRVSSRGRSPFELTEAQVKAAKAIIAGEGAYVKQSRETGWTIIPGGRSLNLPEQANSQGIRANREYSLKKPPGIVRALCFGDSFTHCNDVANDETWPHYAEDTGGVEFLNFGVGGYGVTQALLRYLHEGRPFETDVVILGCISNDLTRSVNAYYPFRLADPSESLNVMGLPYASLDGDGKLVLNPNPLPDADAYRALLADPGRRLRELSELDSRYRPSPPTPMLRLIKGGMGDELAEAWSDVSLRLRRNLNAVLRRNVRVVKNYPVGEHGGCDPRTAIFTINRLLFDRFVSEVKSKGARPVILWFPTQRDFARKRDGREMIYKPFLDHFASMGYDFIDVMDWIAADMAGDDGGLVSDRELLAIGHYSPATNKVIGRRIADHVRRLMAGRQ